jgi:hypothetical protein
MAEPKLRVSLDATVLYAGTGWPRWPYEVLRAAMAGEYALVLVEQVVEEARRHVDGKAQAHVLDYFLSNTPHEVLPMPAADVVHQNLGLIRDESDVPIAVALLEHGVDIHVSNDRDWTEQDATDQSLRDRLGIMLPAVFLRDVLGWQSDDLEAVRNRTWAELAEQSAARHRRIALAGGLPP